MILYVRPYQNTFLRFLYSFFVRMPLELWFRWVSLVIPGSNTFVNYTSLSSTQLADLWLAAQQGIAASPFPATSATSSLTHAPDPRALTVKPQNVSVIAVPDERIANLVKVNTLWSFYKDPSGAILSLTGLSYTEVHAFTCCWRRPRVYAAASELPVVLVYEFQNIILAKLGYDVSAR